MTTQSRVSGHDLALEALKLDLAFAAAGIKEATNNNDGTEIDFVESVFGLEHLSYCAMGVVFDFAKGFGYLTHRLDGLTTPQQIRPVLQAIIANDLPHYFDPNPSCGYMVHAARQRGLWVPYEGGQGVLPGDPVFFDWNGDGAPDHVGQWIEATPDGAKTGEWNVGPQPGSNAGDAQGVYIRERVHTVILGTIRVNRPLPA